MSRISRNDWDIDKWVYVVFNVSIKDFRKHEKRVVNKDFVVYGW